MPPKKELCRNFQRGSCRYGDRCKFLHATGQQPSSNPFGFGGQNGSNFHSPAFQQQNPNPFGFGVKSGIQPNRVANTEGSTQPSLFKPFQNKWTRDSSNTSSSQQNQNQAQASNHKCTDPESCKRLIIEDFEHERPLWKLTCYGHFKYLPCDVTGDTSYEELRAAAYDAAKHGNSLQSIVEKERSLHQAKLVEFENFLRSPYTCQPNSGQNIQNPFFSGITTSPSPFSSGITTSPAPFSSGITTSPAPFPSGITTSPAPFSSGITTSPAPFSSGITTPSTTQNFLQSSVSSFGQPSSSLNMGFGTRSALPSPGPFGQFSGFTQASSPFTSSNMASGHTAPFAGQMSSKVGEGFFSNMKPDTMGGAGSQSGSNTSVSPAFQNVTIHTINQQPLNGFGSRSSGIFPATPGVHPLNNEVKENSSTDPSIWLQQEWKLGEIPEEIPPQEYIR